MTDRTSHTGPAALREAAEAYVAWQYRQPGARRFTLSDLRAALAARPGPSGELTCERCQRPNVWSWHAPSPLWNAVMRDPETGQDEYDIVCPPCFAELAESKGIGGPVIDGRPRWTWHFGPHEDVTDLWQPRDGRVWDGEHCLWVEPAARPGPSGDADATLWADIEALRQDADYRYWVKTHNSGAVADRLLVRSLALRATAPSDGAGGLDVASPDRRSVNQHTYRDGRRSMDQERHR